MRRSYKQVLSIIAAITLLSGGIPQNSPLPLRPALTVSAADISLDDFKYELTSDGEGVIITQYTGSDTAVVVPDEINDMPVTEIGSWASSIKIHYQHQSPGHRDEHRKQRVQPSYQSSGDQYAGRAYHNWQRCVLSKRSDRSQTAG